MAGAARSGCGCKARQSVACFWWSFSHMWLIRRQASGEVWRCARF
jgi:hypothetical protein